MNWLYRRTDVVLVLIACLAILPFLILTFYIHPHYDDYDFHNKVVGQGMGNISQYWWETWSGRFSTIWICSFFAQFMDAENLTAYRLTSFGLILFFLATVFILMKSVIFPKWKQAIFATCVVAAVLFAGLPEITTGFYYVYLSINTGGGTPFLIFLLLICFRVAGGEGKEYRKWMFPAGLCATIAGGSYEPVMVMGVCILAGFWLLLKMNRIPGHGFVLIQFLLLLSAGIVMVLAPGNFARGGDDLLSKGASHFFWSCEFSVLYGAKFILEKLQNLPFLILSLLFLPLAVQLAGNSAKAKKILNINPLIVLIFLFLVIMASFFPGLWATGEMPKPRVLNQSWWILFCGWFLFLQVATLKYGQKITELVGNRHWKPVFCAFLALALVPSLQGKNAGRAWYDLFTKVSAYDQAMEKRYDTIRRSKENGSMKTSLDPLFDDPKKYPLSIYYNYQELSMRNRASDIQNMIYAGYWKLDSVWIHDDATSRFLNNSRRD